MERDQSAKVDTSSIDIGTAEKVEPCLIIAGVRHGSRFPESAKEWSNQAAWPKDGSRFWDWNAGALTEQGTDQMVSVGSKFGEMYPTVFSDNRNMKLFSDSSQKSVQSVSAFLKGAMGGQMPEVKISDQDDDGTFDNVNDNQKEYFRRWEVKNAGGDDTPPARDFAVQVMILDSLIKDPTNEYVLSYTNADGSTESDQLSDWQQHQRENWCEYDNIEDVSYLLSLYRSTGYRPESCVDKVSNTHELYDQMMVNKAVGIKMIPNFVDEPALNADDQENLKSLNSGITSLWYHGTAGNVDGSAGRYAGGLADVMEYSIDRVQGHLQATDGKCDDPRFVMFAGDDRNLLEMFALLGLKPSSWPTFGSYYVIEVYQESVKFCFNWDGEHNAAADPQCVQITRQSTSDDRATTFVSPDALVQDAPVNTNFFMNTLRRYRDDQQLTDAERESVVTTQEMIFKVYDNPFADDYDDASKNA